MQKSWEKTSISYKFENEKYKGGMLIRRLGSAVTTPSIEQVEQFGAALQSLHNGDNLIGGTIITKEKF